MNLLAVSKNYLLITLTLFIVSCGGGTSNTVEDNNVEQTPPSEPQTLTGVLLDSPIENITYSTQTQSGNTNAAGEFSYLPDEEVTFSIGELSFPTIKGKSVITLLDLANTENLMNNFVINIARLMQSLDTDGNANNGITISTSAKDAAINLDFSVSPEEFDASGEVTNFLASAGGNVALIGTSQAIKHFSDTLNNQNIIGSWKLEIENEPSFALFSFTPQGKLIFSTQSSEAEETGIEVANYNWEQASNALTIEVLEDSNGSAGISENIVKTFTLINANTAELVVIDQDAEQKLTLTRLLHAEQSIVGSWYIEDRSDGDVAVSVMNFFSDGTYFFHERQGMEKGTYTWNAETGEFSFDITVSTIMDGGGLSNAPIESFTIDNNTLVITLPDFQVIAQPLQNYTEDGDNQTNAPNLFVQENFSVEKTDGLIYATGIVRSPEIAEKDLLLDVYQPTGIQVPKLKPGVVLVHAGAFQYGDRSLQAENAEIFAKLGYVAISIDYRLTGDDPTAEGIADDANVVTRTTFAAIEDTLKAVLWLKEHAEEYGVDPNRIVLGGFSAGAVASLYAGFAEHGEEYEVQAIIDIAGSFINVAQHIDEADPALFIIQGTLDESISDGVDALELAAENAQIPYEVHRLEGVEHSETLYQLDHWLENDTPLRTQLSNFLYQVLDLDNIDD